MLNQLIAATSTSFRYFIVPVFSAGASAAGGPAAEGPMRQGEDLETLFIEIKQRNYEKVYGNGVFAEGGLSSHAGGANVTKIYLVFVLD